MTAWLNALQSARRAQPLDRTSRIGIVSPCIVIYRFREDEQIVTVLRIVHGRRRITGALLRALP